MALIFRLVRLFLPLILMFLFFRFIRNLLYTMNRGGYGYPGGSSSSSGQTAGPHRNAGRSDPYSVLGCSRNASDEEIRSCYRKLVAKYHPDKFIGQDLDEEFIELATRRFKEIQNAYEEIRRMRGMG